MKSRRRRQPGHLFPLATQVLGLLQSFSILPTVLLTLVKPHGHVFQGDAERPQRPGNDLRARHFLERGGIEWG